MKPRKSLVRPGMCAAAKASRRRLRATLLLCAALFATAARAADEQQTAWPQVWVNPGIYSQHFDSGKGLRNNNIGFGVEAVLARDHAVMAGSFINSNRTRSHFAAYQWRPLHWEFSGLTASAGVAIGAFDGYPNYRQGAWFVAPLPMVAIEGRRLGANVSIIPTVANRFDGAIAVQVKLRVW